ncbi:hypothetical protein [Ralstonia pseudosolanacearum]|uniref:hypothetical protein n=1 Tax=Ralstonia pseudosolanacearum TaxID=1310165 RepID=UPI003CEABA84
MNLLRGFSDRFLLRLRLPRVVEDIGDYRANFERAARFTASCGYLQEEPRWSEGDALDGAAIDRALESSVMIAIKGPAAQCVTWCHRLAPALEAEVGCRVWFTLGQLWRAGRPVFNPSWHDLRRWSKQGIRHDDLKGRTGANIHAWLTLETGEILEPTLLSTYAAFRGEHFARFYGLVASGRDPGVVHDHRYFPMMVGSEVAEAMRDRSVIQLL